jgi:L-ribulokinase
VNPNLRGVTFGWNLQSTAQDELYAAIEGTAFHTRVILDRMAEHGVAIRRVINAVGIPQKNDVLKGLPPTFSGVRCWCRARVSSAWARPSSLFWPQGRSRASKRHRKISARRIGCMNPIPRRKRSMRNFIPSTRRCTFECGQPGKGGLGNILPALIQATERVRSASVPVAAS